MSFENLVPRPDPSRWQTTTEAPFHTLRSEEARAAFACCNLDSSMQDSQDQRGRPAYACFVGDTAIWRRQPLQLQTTLAFMLAKDDGRLFRVKATDFDNVRKCLLWLRAKNVHVRLLMANLMEVWRPLLEDPDVGSTRAQRYACTYRAVAVGAGIGRAPALILAVHHGAVQVAAGERGSRLF